MYIYIYIYTHVYYRCMFMCLSIHKLEADLPAHGGC